MGSRRDDGPADGEVRAYSGRPYGWDGSEDITGLGQEVAARFLAAGLELNSALSMMGEDPAVDRCARALDELDDAIGQVRHLALAAHERAGDLKSPLNGRPCRGPWAGRAGVSARDEAALADALWRGGTFDLSGRPDVRAARERTPAAVMTRGGRCARVAADGVEV